MQVFYLTNIATSYYFLPVFSTLILIKDAKNIYIY